MQPRTLITNLLLLSVVATAVADLGFMHASNALWPPHARFHAIWNVWHVAFTHSLAIALLWSPNPLTPVWRGRVALGILLAFVVSFFVANGFSGMFEASVHPDVPPRLAPPRLFGLDGNTFGFLLALPVIAWLWWRVERSGLSS